MPRIYTIDISTTGNDLERDEILQLSIIDENGSVVFNEYFKPVYMNLWPVAAVINNITPSMVKDKEPFSMYSEQVTDILSDADIIVGYNHLAFDIPFLKRYGVLFPHQQGIVYVDMMNEFAPLYGEWNETLDAYRVKSLLVCSEYFGYDFKPCDSLNNVKATLHCYYKYLDLVKFLNTLNSTDREMYEVFRSLNVDLTDFMRKGFTYEQFNVIGFGIKDGCSPAILNNPGFSPAQLRLLVQGGIEGADVAAFARPEIPLKVMEKCCELTLHGKHSIASLGGIAAVERLVKQQE